MTDDWLGKFVDRLHDLNLERDTVIVLVGDHGILLGEHGWTGKISTALYPALTRVPLILVHPHRRRAGLESTGSRPRTTWRPRSCRWPACGARTG